MKGIGWKSSSRSLSLACVALLAACGTDPAGESSADGGVLADTSGSGSVDTGLNDTSTVADTAEDTIADTAVEDVAPDAESDTVADTGMDTADDTTQTLGELPCEVATILETNCQGCHGAVPVYGAAFSMLTMADLLSPSFTARVSWKVMPAASMNLTTVSRWRFVYLVLNRAAFIRSMPSIASALIPSSKFLFFSLA